MDLKDLFAISGHSGLFKFVSQGRNGIIVESLEDQKRTLAHASSKVSALEDIAIFTDEKEIPLKEVLKQIYEKENGGEAIHHKSSADELKKYFEQILPDYDKDKVYVSDIKKVILWYNQLHKYKMLDFSEEIKEKVKEEKKEENDKTVRTKKKSSNPEENKN